MKTPQQAHLLPFSELSLWAGHQATPSCPLALACSGHPEQEKARPDHTCGPCPLACLLERPGSFCPSLISVSPPPLRALVQSRGSFLLEKTEARQTAVAHRAAGRVRAMPARSGCWESLVSSSQRTDALSSVLGREERAPTPPTAAV